MTKRILIVLVGVFIFRALQVIAGQARELEALRGPTKPVAPVAPSNPYREFDHEGEAAPVFSFNQTATWEDFRKAWNR